MGEAGIREAVSGENWWTDGREMKTKRKKWVVGGRTLQTEDLVVVKTAATGATKAIVRGRARKEGRCERG